jgi:hypothetical protein
MDPWNVIKMYVWNFVAGLRHSGGSRDDCLLQLLNFLEWWLSQHLPRVNEENNENLSQGIQSPGRDWNRAPPDCKSEALHLEPPCSAKILKHHLWLSNLEAPGHRLEAWPRGNLFVLTIEDGTLPFLWLAPLRVFVTTSCGWHHSVWDPKFHYCVHKSWSPVIIVTQMNTIYILTPTCILILSSHLRLGLPSGLFPSCFPTKIFLQISHLSHARYMPHPSRRPWFSHSNNIWWWVKLMQLLIMQFPRVSCHFIPLRTEFSNTLNICSFLVAREQVPFN